MARWLYRYRTAPVAAWRYANILRHIRADAGWDPTEIQRRGTVRKDDTGYHDYGTLKRGVVRRAESSRQRPPQ